jgi:hypothetical protein
MSNDKYEQEKAWRRDLHEGKGVAICNNMARRDRYTTGTVSRVTATQLIITNYVGRELRFNRDSGREVGSGRSEIQEITPQIRASIKEHRDRAEFSALTYRPDNLPADEIAAMLEAVKVLREFKATKASAE